MLRVSRLLCVAAAVVLACGAPISAQTICDKYTAIVLGTANAANEQALVTEVVKRAVLGVKDASEALGTTGTIAVLDSAAPAILLYSVANMNRLQGTLTLTGVTAGTTLRGIDRRSIDNTLNAIGSDGQVYRANISPTILTGAATGTIALEKVGTAAAANGRGTPSNGVVGYDFNPLADAMRIIQGTANFRIGGAAAAVPGNAAGEDGTETGNTCAYAPEDDNEGSTPNIAAVAYFNAVIVPAPPANTVEYAIDAAVGNGALVRVDPSNTCVLNSIGALALSGPIDAATAAMDAVQGSDSNTLVALLKVGDAQGIYTVDAATGSATLVQALGNTEYNGIAFFPATPQNGISNPDNAVTGIVNVPDLVRFFDGTVKYRGDDTPSYTTDSEELNALVLSLVKFFGAPGALGCTAPGFPQYDGRSMLAAHTNMNISKDTFDAFNAQVASSALSFGVSQGEVDAVAGVLQSFSRATTAAGALGPNVICSMPDCACAPGTTGGQCVIAADGDSSSSTGDNSGDGGAASTVAASGVVGVLTMAAAALAMRQ